MHEELNFPELFELSSETPFLESQTVEWPKLGVQAPENLLGTKRTEKPAVRHLFTHHRET
jgi:hypothetical protein